MKFEFSYETEEELNTKLLFVCKKRALLPSKNPDSIMIQSEFAWDAAVQSGVFNETDQTAFKSGFTAGYEAALR